MVNIRSVSNPATVDAKDKVESSRRDIKSDNTDEREGNGQQPFGDDPKRRSLTAEELEQVVKKLEAHEGIVKHSLQVNLYADGQVPIVKIEAADGQVVKRLSEAELFDLLFEEKGNNFSLVKKTA